MAGCYRGTRFCLLHGWPREMVYEVKYFIADLPVSPPSSPRPDGGDGHPVYDFEYTLLHVFDTVIWPFTRSETAYRNKRSFPRNIKQKNIKQKNISKSMRRMGKLKQPGGASCNQRR